MTREGWEPGVAVPPGETVQEYIDMREVSRMELAERLGIAPKAISDIVEGNAPITPGIAVALESVFGTPARFWVALEANYRGMRAG